MYRVKIGNNGTSQFQVESDNYRFTIDTEGSGITPPATLLASLGSCIGVYLRKYAEGAKLDLGSFSIDLQAELSREKPVSFREIKVVVTCDGARLDEHRKKALAAFIKNCPVHNTLRSGPQIEITIV